MTKKLYVKSEALAQVANVLTGYGHIVGMDHEGTIEYEIEGEDSFDLGRQVQMIQEELRAYYTDARILSAQALAKS